MAKKLSYTHSLRPKKKRPGTHSKNASRNQKGWKKKSRGQGKTQ